MFAGGGIDVEPRCVELAKRKAVYRARRRHAPRAALAGGRIGRGIGGIGLRARRVGGAPRRSARPPRRAAVAVRYCLDGGGTLSAGFRGPGDGRRVSIVTSDSPAFRSRGVAPRA